MKRVFGLFLSAFAGAVAQSRTTASANRPIRSLIGQAVTYHDRKLMQTRLGMISDTYDKQPNLVIVQLDSGHSRLSVPLIQEGQTVTGYVHYCVPREWA